MIFLYFLKKLQNFLKNLKLLQTLLENVFKTLKFYSKNNKIYYFIQKKITFFNISLKLL